MSETLAQTSGGARAEGLVDWFLTPDQQGQIALNRRDFSRAADLFAAPMQKGHALALAGRYTEAAALYAGLDSAEAALAQGNALIRARQYRPAVRAFETALERRPDYPEAARNLDLARAIVDDVEQAREASDTGEDRGNGADDTVYDNEAARGAETAADPAPDGAAPLTEAQWLQSIDTRMGDFLRSRFLLGLSAADAGDRP